MSQAAELALKSLITVAQGHTGQSEIVADFLLSWWNAEECGGFDMTRLWAVDTVIAEEMVMVFGLVAGTHSYPDTLGYGKEFQSLIRSWRPKLAA